MRQVVFRVRHPLAAIVTSALAIVCEPEMALAQVELEGVTILSTRSERDVYDIPANVTVIDRDELDKENVKDIDQLVRNVPGVIVSRQTSATDPFNTFGGFTIRGVGANRVQITVDGSRIAESIQDGTRDYISLDLVRSVDIVRGPASVLWGSDALGGLVAFETLDPEDILAPGSLMNGELKTSYDSENEAWKKTAIVAGSISPHVQFLAAYSTITANEVERSKARADGGIWGCPRNIDFGATPCNQLNPTDILSNNFLGKIVATPAPGHRVELTADILDRKIEVDQRHDLGPEFSTITGLPTGAVTEDFQRVLDLQRQRYAVEHKWDVGNELFENIKWVLSYSPQDYAREGRRVRTLANGNRVVIEDTLDFSEQFTEADIQFVSHSKSPGSGIGSLTVLTATSRARIMSGGM